MPDETPVQEASFEELNPETSAALASEQKPTQEQGKETGKPANGSVPVSQAAPAIDGDSEALLTLMADLGINKDNVHELTEKSKTLTQLNYLLENNPSEFYSYIERSSPAVFQKMLEKATDIYLDRYYTEAPQDGSAKASQSRGTVSGDNPEIRSLKSQLEALQKRVIGKEQTEQYEQSKKAYFDKVDSLVGKLDSISKKDQKAVRALLNESVANDATALKRIQQGIYIDLPRHLQKVLNDWTAETTGAAESEKRERAAVESRAGKGTNEVASGASPAGGQDVLGSDIWESGVTAFANDLKKSKAAAAKK